MEQIADKKPKPILSIVTSLYWSGRYIEEFYRRSVQAAESVTPKFEILFVNDGSPDDSLAKAIRIFEKDKRVKIIDLSKNFGQHKACLTGLEHTRGDFVFLLEADLEESPSWLIDFYAQMLSSAELDVVFGIQKSRKGGLFERVSGQVFYSLFNRIAEVKLPENHVTARLMKRRYVEALLEYKEKELFLGGIYELTGFKQSPHTVEKLSHSKTTYTLSKKMTLIANSITSFSTFPLQFIFWTGLFISTAALLLVAFILYRWRVHAVAPGFTSIIASIWLIGGIMIFFLGVIGLYIRKILGEVVPRPFTTIRKIYEA